MWCSGGCSWKCYKTSTFCSLLRSCPIPFACHANRHLNLQRWSEPGVVCAFWLRHVLRATTACNCSSLIWPDGSAPAALASLLFDPPEPTFSLPFRASASSFFWLFLFYHLLSSALLFSLPLPISAFHLSISSEVWLLNFLPIYECFKHIISDVALQLHLIPVETDSHTSQYAVTQKCHLLQCTHIPSVFLAKPCSSNVFYALNFLNMLVWK